MKRRLLNHILASFYITTFAIILIYHAILEIWIGKNYRISPIYWAHSSNWTAIEAWLLNLLGGLFWRWQNLFKVYLMRFIK